METEKDDKKSQDMGKETCDAITAATKIQAGFRGYKVRKQMKVKKNGPDTKEAMKRCAAGRRKSASRRSENGYSDLEEKSATKIQAGIRGFLVRKKQKEQKPAS